MSASRKGFRVFLWSLVFCLPRLLSADVIDVFFAPGDNCTQVLTDGILAAKHTILIQAYEFTDPSIAAAVLTARKNGVTVSILLDYNASRSVSCKGGLCNKAGCLVRLDMVHHIAHNKIIIIDDSTLFTGSFNFSVSAQKNNAENLLRISAAPELIKKYTDNWQFHEKHCVPWLDPPKRPGEQNRLRPWARIRTVQQEGGTDATSANYRNLGPGWQLSSRFVALEGVPGLWASPPQFDEQPVEH